MFSHAEIAVFGQLGSQLPQLMQSSRMTIAMKSTLLFGPKARMRNAVAPDASAPGIGKFLSAQPFGNDLGARRFDHRRRLMPLRRATAPPAIA
jgi:hypothetical protein